LKSSQTHPTTAEVLNNAVMRNGLADHVGPIMLARSTKRTLFVRDHLRRQPAVRQRLAGKAKCGLVQLRIVIPSEARDMGSCLRQTVSRLRVGPAFPHHAVGAGILMLRRHKLSDCTYNIANFTGTFRPFCPLQGLPLGLLLTPMES
jgi:hypothetical protein